MESLGWLSYHFWKAPLRQRVAKAIAAEGVWLGPVPEVAGAGGDGASGRRQAALAGAVAAAAVAVAGVAAVRAWRG